MPCRMTSSKLQIRATRNNPQLKKSKHREYPVHNFHLHANRESLEN